MAKSIIYKKPAKISQGDILKIDADTLKKHGVVISDDLSEDFIGIIVLSNSCDLINHNINQVVFAPILKISYIMTQYTKVKIASGNKRSDIKKNLPKYLNSICQYEPKKYFFLPLDTSYGFNYDSCALLDYSFSLDYDISLDVIKSNSNRITLRNPFKEKLGYKMGNLFSRISTDDHKKGYNKEMFDHFRTTFESLFPKKE